MKSELLIIIFHLLGFILLMQGLFPYSSSTNDIANRSCFDSQESSNGHLIIMIIDALRADYVFNRNHSYYLKSIHQLEDAGKALSIKLRTHTPTVTLPRLKALLTGTIPSFWDVLFNYNTSELQIDNLLSQYKQRYPTKKIVFYGDDTWLKLFPQNIFTRSQGLQSFFVTDFKEIDLNVTIGLYSELNHMNDWNVLIVHYLGLDHIGHAYGAFNTLIQEKLSEMDEIIMKIYSQMNSNDLLLITGDHGMANQGGHGGSSDVEKYVPASLISHQTKDKFNRIDDNDEEYLQIDLTPTLSAFLQIPIPYHNLGILIEKFFRNLNRSHLLQCLIDDNRRQLMNLLSQQQQQLLTSGNNLQDIRQQAMIISNEQDLKILLLSLTLFGLSICLFYFTIPTISLLSMIILMISYLISMNIFISLGIGAISFCFIVLGMGERKIRDHQMKDNNKKKFSNRFLLIYPYLHLISLFSSSFIEEEHQCWYYFFSTYLFLRMIEQKSFQSIGMLFLARVIRSWNQTGNKWLNQPDIGDFLNKNENHVYLVIIHVISSILFVYLINKSRRYSISYLLPIIVFIYRWNLFGWLSSLTPLLYYVLLLFLLITKKFSITNIVFSLLYLLCRTHNCVIIVIHMIFYEFIDVIDARAIVLFSQCAFFHLGNSNSFVTLDISSGFVGLPIYLPIIHGILIYLSTYGLSIIWLLKLSKDERIHCLFQMILINNLFSLCIFLQRYHLFVWTVFAPKVFYLCAQTVFHFLLFL